MIKISHRGNLDGPNEKMENHPDYINKALLEMEVEIDVWYVFGQFVLGHDIPQYEVGGEFFTDRMWCHAKNIDALYQLLENDLHCFWHEEDACTVTNRGYMWTYRNQPLTPKSICVLPELMTEEVTGLHNIAGYCSDFRVPDVFERYRSCKGLL